MQALKARWTKKELEYVGKRVVVYSRDRLGEAIEASYELASVLDLHIDTFGEKLLKIVPDKRGFDGARHVLLFNLNNRSCARTWDRPKCYFAFDGEEV